MIGEQSSRGGAVGVAILAIMIAVAVFAPVVAPYSPTAIDVPEMLHGPSWIHWLGTDEYGRDVLSRTIYAARVSLRVAFQAAGIGLLAGVTIGVVAAYFGRIADFALMRVMDLLFSFPPILLAIALMASLGTSVANATLAIGIVFIPAFARVARAAAGVALREPYVEAARAMGMGPLRTIGRELLPNLARPLLATAAAAAAAAMLIESALSFLGLATQIPDASWGSLIFVARGFAADAPWLIFAPGAAIVLAVLAFGLVADGLRTAFVARQAAE